MKIKTTSLGSLYESKSCFFFFGNKNSNQETISRTYPNLKFYTLKQTHGDTVIEARPFAQEADAHFTSETNKALCVATADCIPILISANDKKIVAAIHAGWRGVANQITIKTIKRLISLGADPKYFSVLIGPHINFKSFEVDGLVKNEILKSVNDTESSFIKDLGNNKFLLDLKSVLIAQLKQENILTENIYSEPVDTMVNSNYNSYRRDKEKSGRQISWIAQK